MAEVWVRRPFWHIPTRLLVYLEDLDEFVLIGGYLDHYVHVENGTPKDVLRPFVRKEEAPVRRDLILKCKETICRVEKPLVFEFFREFAKLVKTYKLLEYLYDD